MSARTIPPGFVKGHGDTYFGESEPPEPVQAAIAIANASGHPFVPAGTLYTMRDDADGSMPVVMLLRRGCDYGQEIKTGVMLAQHMRADLFLAFNNRDDFNSMSRAFARHRVPEGVDDARR